MIIQYSGNIVPGEMNRISFSLSLSPFFFFFLVEQDIQSEKKKITRERLEKISIIGWETAYCQKEQLSCRSSGEEDNIIFKKEKKRVSVLVKNKCGISVECKSQIIQGILELVQDFGLYSNYYEKLWRGRSSHLLYRIIRQNTMK